ncbi:MAG: hypothetical protein RI942_1353 [Pseudomonadota bacterium]|jgi:hypothetical protein
MEARVGIEPALTDLQSAASPLCHRASEDNPADCAVARAKTASSQGRVLYRSH